ncbi:hypothetical protein GT347_24735 [Xylophilus rhododendri]|uniref:Acyl-CoA dehydrogenase n=1 Tax=Xylophilus rhododendri TaxID=2697032 RepID=A0A857JD75_9BURK|nr:acyl-CoA dehydrogenase family protein [Xylophilus rhododendri]QHJ00913.1 hypothetical protein GT347_24735 [Xylophilus rhododendri]
MNSRFRMDGLSLGFEGAQAQALDAVLTTLADKAAERDRLGGSLAAELRQLAEAGATSARLPVAQGGRGFSYSQNVDLLIALARADSSAAQSLRSHFLYVEHLVSAPELPGSDFGAAEVARGRLFASATTEIGNVAVGAVGTTVLPDLQGRLRLDGSKFYTTGAGYADWVNVFAGDAEGQHVIATVERETPGVTVVDDWDGVGQRLTMSGTMQFDQVAVDPARVRRRSQSEDRPSGRHDAMAQLTHLATLTGIAIRAFEDAAGWLQGRKRHFSHAAAPVPALDPLVQELIGRLSAVAGTALLAVRSAARQLETPRADASGDPFADAHRSVTQLQVVLPALVLDATQALFDIGGGSMVVAGRGFDRHWRNARTLASHNPSPQKARVLGNEALNGVALPDIWYAGTAAPAASPGVVRSGVAG